MPILIIIFFSPSLVRTLPLSPTAVCKHARWRLGGQLPLRREQGWQVTFPLFPLLEGLKDSMCFLFLQQSLVSPHVLSFLQKYSIDLTTCWVLTSCLKSPIHLDCRPISPFLKFLGKSTVFLFWIHAHIQFNTQAFEVVILNTGPISFYHDAWKVQIFGIMRIYFFRQKFGQDFKIHVEVPPQVMKLES